jgi:hypothetical protein
MNGVESETAKVIKEVNQLAENPASSPTESRTPDPVVKDESGNESEEVSGDAGAADEATPAKSTRSKTKSGTKGKKT